MHNICYRVFAENVSKESIAHEVEYMVSHSGDGYGSSVPRFPAVNPLPSRADAEAYISKHCTDFYGSMAVKYHDTDACPATKKVLELQSKRTQVEDALHEYITNHMPNQQKADYIGCKHCGSKISKQHLRGACCPVCRADMRSPSTLERINRYNEALMEINSKIHEERKKGASKAPVKWLVKFEYHS